jgi:hypothetical protein
MILLQDGGEVTTIRHKVRGDYAVGIATPLDYLVMVFCSERSTNPISKPRIPQREYGRGAFSGTYGIIAVQVEVQTQAIRLTPRADTQWRRTQTTTRRNSVLAKKKQKWKGIQGFKTILTIRKKRERSEKREKLNSGHFSVHFLLKKKSEVF